MPSEKYHELSGQIYIANKDWSWWLGAMLGFPVIFITVTCCLRITHVLELEWYLTGPAAGLLFLLCSLRMLTHYTRLHMLKELRDAQTKIDTLTDEHTRYVAALPARIVQAELALHMLAERFGVNADLYEIWSGNPKHVKYNRLHATIDGRRLVSDYGSLHVNITHDDSVVVTSCLKGQRYGPAQEVDESFKYTETVEEQEFAPPQEPQQPLPL